MDLRRIHSSSLVDSSSSNGPEKSSFKLPHLFRTLKSKLDSLGTGKQKRRSSAVLSTLGGFSGPASPPDSPAALHVPGSTAGPSTNAGLQQQCSIPSPLTRTGGLLQSRLPKSVAPSSCATPATASSSSLYSSASTSTLPAPTKLASALAEASSSIPGGGRNPSSVASSGAFAIQSNGSPPASNSNSTATNIPAFARVSAPNPSSLVTQPLPTLPLGGAVLGSSTHIGPPLPDPCATSPVAGAAGHGLGASIIATTATTTLASIRLPPKGAQSESADAPPPSPPPLPPPLPLPPPAAAPAAEAGTGIRKLLAVSPALPAEMRRSVWTLEDFIISKRLHKSNSSSVYRAVCRRSGTVVALKVYLLSRVACNVLHMLKREIEIHTQLTHRNIARLYAAFLDEGDRVILVQEYAAQGDLYGVVQRLGGRLPPEQVAEGVLRPFLEALSYMHGRGICHRDIKPENILFTGSWRLLVADFGVSIDLSRERAVTRAGTEGYMAPEVERCPIKNNPEDNKDDPRYAYSAAVDIWAVGVLAYELMVGFPPVVVATASAAAPADHDVISASSDDAAAAALSGFVKSQMTAASLHFPASVPPAARSFILDALVADPLERPTAAQLLRHPWLQVQPAAPAAALAGGPVRSGGDGLSPCTSVQQHTTRTVWEDGICRTSPDRQQA